MLPTFLIHSSDSKDRDEIVANLVNETNAEIVEAIILDNRLLGCSMSHLKVAHLARHLYPNAPYLVFEDDCVLKPGWNEALSNLSGEVVYLGYNDRHVSGVLFGTHAMLIYPKARDFLIEHLEAELRKTVFTLPIDWLCWQLWQKGQFEVGYPDQKDVYCEQKKGLVSLISGNIR